MNDLPLIAHARRHGNAVAVRSVGGEASFQQLLDRSARLAAAMLGDAEDLNEARIAFLAPAGSDYIAAQWATWRAGGIAVPLSLSAAEPELEYTLRDSESSQVAVTAAMADQLRPLCRKLGLPLLILDEDLEPKEKTLPTVSPDRRGMILYTSGTTSKPKGVVTTHANIAAQIESLVQAWEWEADDCVPLFLPLHHIHGIINILCSALWSGAVLEPFPSFDREAILNRIAAQAYTLFMAVPTVYVKLIEDLEHRSDEERSRIVAGFSLMRLMVSGSAALPESIHDKWSALTGQVLLERYGMTEIGMALSNPYHGERRAGTVGQPLPGVEVRLKSEEGEVVENQGEPGEIQVKGPGVFREYWNRPGVTRDSFEDGWFCTGDLAVRENGYYRILGRQSVDIIKSGGYKLSALEIEAVLLEHADIAECAVVGLPDDTWGEIVAVAAVLRPGRSPDWEALQTWCGERLSPYKIPKRFLAVEALPRNAMGKVAKPAVRDLWSGEVSNG